MKLEEERYLKAEEYNMEGAATPPLKIAAGLIRSGALAQVRVAVVGDLMLDRYMYGTVSRISQEAPVPIVKYESRKEVPGGACNVAANLTGLGVAPIVFGRIGADTEGETLLSLPQLSLADVSHVVRRGRTIVKARVMGGAHLQMLRLDAEEFTEPDGSEMETVLNGISDCLNSGVRDVIISDYAKGFCSYELCRRIIKLCRSRSARVTVDPKVADWSRYSGAFLATPNVNELCEAAGRRVANEDDEIADAGAETARKYGIENLLVTRSHKGVTLISGSSAEHIGAGAVEVFDVSGAGDTVAAVTAAFTSAGMKLADAVSVANSAAQTVIGKSGTYPIKSADLLEAEERRTLYSLVPRFPSVKRRIIEKRADRETASAKVREWRSNGLSVVFTNGCFDILHAGHAALLEEASAMGSKLVVGLNSDASVKRLKGESRPVNGCTERAALLAAMESVDMVVVFDEDTPAELLSELRPDIIVKGGDYRPDEVIGAEYAGEVRIVPLLEGFSTTNIISEITSSSDNGKKRWIILDRDGTVIEDKNYLSDPGGAELLPNAAEGLSKLAEAGYKFVVVTNQSGVGRGYYRESDMNAVNSRVKELLEEKGVTIEGFYCCTHRPDENCGCRKPKGGLAELAASELGFELRDVLCVIGDKESDIKLADNIGAKSVLVMTGYGKSEAESGVGADIRACDLKDAARIIIERFGDA